MSHLRTLVLLKPDALCRNLVGTIISRFEHAGFDIADTTSTVPDESLLATHYEHLTEESYYPGLVEYMRSGLVIVLVLEGPNAVEEVRDLIGDTEPESADPGTIRGDLADDSYERADSEGRALYNLVHASEHPNAAEKEIDLWFDCSPRLAHLQLTAHSTSKAMCSSRG